MTGQDSLKSVQYVAQKLGVSEDTVYRLVKGGELGGYLVGQQYRVLWSSVLAYLERRKVNNEKGGE